MRESMTLCAIGMGIGTLTALALGRIVESLLFGVTAHDPVTYTTVLAVLIATVGLASWLPAARASRVSPTEALRAE
jgi:ABC-type antimicrobial peptide transport system permease subunit